jgi:hypothetical protein
MYRDLNFRASGKLLPGLGVHVGACRPKAATAVGLCAPAAGTGRGRGGGATRAATGAAGARSRQSTGAGRGGASWRRVGAGVGGRVEGRRSAKEAARAVLEGVKHLLRPERHGERVCLLLGAMPGKSANRGTNKQLLTP